MRLKMLVMTCLGLAAGVLAVPPASAGALVACVNPNGYIVVLEQCSATQTHLNMNRLPAGPPGPPGPPGAPGPPGPPGPAGISQAEFVGTGLTAINDAFTLVLSRAVPAGSWVFVATINGIGRLLLNGGSLGSECELRTGSGGFIGGTFVIAEVSDMTVVGGSFVPSGAQFIQLWCRTDGGGQFQGAQILIMQIGGFGSF